MDENKNSWINTSGYIFGVDKAVGVDATPQMTATLWVMLEEVKHEATRAREYLRLTGATYTPDRVHEILHLRTSRATLGRKMREAAQRGELLRSYYVNERGTKICQYAFNQDYKEAE